MTGVKRWLALTARTPSARGGELLAEGLVLLGGGAVEERDDGYITYLPEPPNLPAFLRRARETLLAHAGLAEVDLTWRWQEHEDWAELWKRGLGPRRVTGRLVVTPTWEEPDPRPGDVVVRIDPGIAFGTAEHATTRGCLRLLEPLVREGDRILDVGTGSGILAIAAARLGASRVVAVDSDPYACETARENVRTNGVGEVVEVVESTAADDTLGALRRFDGVLANLETPILHPLLEPMSRSARPGGWIILSGIQAAERGAMLQAAGALGLALDAEDGDGEWWSVRLRRPGDPERSRPVAP